MEVKGYFQKIRAVEDSLPGDQVVVSTLATPDGGREGRLLELSRSLAAKMIVDRRARLATEEESERHRKKVREETAESAARLAEPKTTFLAEINNVHHEIKKTRKR
jgi:hypothetical protein